MMIISLSIDLSKLDKSKIVHGKNGAMYYNLTATISDTKDKFDNDISVYDKQSKDQRDAKEKKNFVGSGRKLWEGNKTEKTDTIKQSITNDALPF